jgi:uncharacterized protein
MPAAAELPPLPELTGRSFALLDQAERDRLGAILRPLPWIDGLITAAVIAREDAAADPADGDDWIDYVWNEGEEELGKLTLTQTNDVVTMMVDHYCHVAETLFERPEAYCPYLAGPGDRLEAAAQWAAGFRLGICANPKPWRPLIDADDARALLVAIFSLERDEDLAKGSDLGSPFQGMPAERREHMRRSALELLPNLVVVLHDYALGVEFGHEDQDGEPVEPPYIRDAPKIGRNDPCPCGSGKKYKKCCLDQA